MNEAIPVGLTALVVLAYVISAFYVREKQKKEALERQRRWIEQLPSLISTLGVVGTFIGITIGLIQFDSSIGKIAESIPRLLEGLKTAFFTSLAGMVGSLLLSKQVNSAFDKKSQEISDSMQAASAVVDAVNNLSSQTRAMVDLVSAMQETISSINTNHLHVHTETAKTLSSIQNEIEHLSAEGAKSIASNQEKLIKVAEKLGKAQEAVREQAELAAESISELNSNLHNEASEVRAAIEGTNDLLAKKFNEFSELLKRSNTEALVEVMKKVTEEFQKQMGELINKLVQENFEQLNKSVEQLNSWQKENKEMISSLTLQYKEMSENFEQTSVTLDKVGGNTKLLVSEGGKLNQLINALNKVLIEDTKFIETSTTLAETARLSKDNMQKFDDATTTLNEWVKKQRNFVEAVNVLLVKLEEISRLKDYSAEFWRDTKKGFDDFTMHLKQLDNGLEKLDEKFYNRLSATLSELDSCIQAMVNGKE